MRGNGVTGAAGPAGGPPRRRLPDGFRVLLDRRTRVLDDGAVLLGGAPPRMMHLAPAARAMLVGGGLTVDGPSSAGFARRLLDAGLGQPVPAGSAPAPPSEVTVVVPVRDRTDGLARLLDALVAQRLGLAEVIVVDDGSADPDAVGAVVDRARQPGRAAPEAAPIRVLREHLSRGPAAARNRGLAAAATPLVAFLDSDVVPEPGWLAVLAGAFTDPAVALAAPRIVALPPVRGWLGRYEAVRSALDLGPDPAPVVPRSRVAYVPSAALLVDREAVLSLGPGFDEDMHVAEDVDLVLRLYRAGRGLRYVPQARVAHDHRSTVVAWWRRKAFYGTGAAPLALRHPGAVPPMVLTPWSALAGALIVTARPRALLAAGVVGAVAADRLSRTLSRVSRPRATAARLVGLGTLAAVSQTADAITRHYWPVAAVACVLAPRARRTVLTVALVEGVVDWWRHRGRDRRVRPGPLGHLLAHRLDDLGYGAGLWWGAWRHRTWEPLRPGRPGAGRPDRRGRPGRIRPGVPGS